MEDQEDAALGKDKAALLTKVTSLQKRSHAYNTSGFLLGTS